MFDNNKQNFQQMKYKIHHSISIKMLSYKRNNMLWDMQLQEKDQLAGNINSAPSHNPVGCFPITAQHSILFLNGYVDNSFRFLLLMLSIILLWIYDIQLAIESLLSGKRETEFYCFIYLLLCNYISKIEFSEVSFNFSLNCSSAGSFWKVCFCPT